MSYTAGQRVKAGDLNGNTFQLLQSNLLGADQGSVVLTVPTGAVYNRLKVYYDARGTSATTATPLYLQVNADTGSNYLVERLETNNTTSTGTGSGGATSTKVQVGTLVCATGDASHCSSGEILIGSAGSTAFMKNIVGIMVGLVSNSNAYIGTYGGVWLNTALVTSVTISPAGGNILAGSSFSLYGLN